MHFLVSEFKNMGFSLMSQYLLFVGDGATASLVLRQPLVWDCSEIVPQQTHDHIINSSFNPLDSSVILSVFWTMIGQVWWPSTNWTACSCHQQLRGSSTTWKMICRDGWFIDPSKEITLLLPLQLIAAQ